MSQFVPVSRRDWLHSATLAIGAGCSVSGWFAPLAARAAKRKERGKSLILLWMSGGPATIDLWDLKPGHANGGPFQEIQTATPGIRISEHLPKLANWTNDLAIIRSMRTKEGDHDRATFLLRTGYVPQGAIQFPALGSIVAQELGREAVDLPAFVSVAPRRLGATASGGFLGPPAAPLILGERAVSPEDLKVDNLQPPADSAPEAQSTRLALLGDLDRAFTAERSSPVIDSLRSASGRAIRMMRPEVAQAFQLDEESEATRNAYGRSVFGQGCLLARRLVERGVACVEVTLDGWDTHQNNFDQVQQLSGALDAGFSALLCDLTDRGLLGTTLVVCQGEFGRTPKINNNKGRDHWPQSWATVLAGGGIRGGLTIGKTSADGTVVEDRPVGVPDLIATVCRSLAIDYRKQNISNVSRPIRIADPIGEPIQELT